MAFTTFHNDWTGWAGAISGTVTIISQATFLSENPTASMPKDFPAAAKILKCEQPTASTSSALARSPTGLAIDHTAWRNIIIRSYVPQANVGSVSDAGWNFQLLDSGFNNRSTKFRFFGTSQSSTYTYGHSSFIEDPNDTGWKYSQWNADAGGYDPTDVNRLIIQYASSSSASVGTPAVIYFFDMIRDATEDTPVVAFSADDGADDQYDHMFTSSKASADNIPISLSVIPELIDSDDAKFLTTAELNEMYADNCDVIGHSNAAFGDPAPGVTPVLNTTEDIQHYLTSTSIPFLANYKKNGGNHVWVFAEGKYKNSVAEQEYQDTYETLLVNNDFGMMRRVNNRFNNAGQVGLDNLTQLRSFSLGRSLVVDATSTDDTSVSAAFMTDTGAAFTVNEFVGQNVRNDTDGSTAVITANTTTTITGTLVGGVANEWNSGDTYSVTDVSSEGIGPCESAADVAAVLDKIEDMGISCCFHVHTFPLIATGGTQFPRGDWPTVTADLRVRADASDIELRSLANYGIDLDIIDTDDAGGIMQPIMASGY